MENSRDVLDILQAISGYRTLQLKEFSVTVSCLVPSVEGGC